MIRYVRELDGLRAVCAMAVVGIHTMPAAVPNGLLGVDVFFALSGFLITKLLISEHEATGRVLLLRFYVRRALRLWPALILVAAGYVALAVAIKEGVDFDRRMAAVPPAVLYYMNWYRIFTNTGGQGLGHTWSLAVEEQGELLWPLAFLAVARLKPDARPAFVLAMLVAVIAWRLFLALQGATEARLGNGFDTRADILLVGCLAALLPNRGTLARGAGRSWMVPAAILAISVFLPRPTAPLDIAIVFPLYALLAGWLVLGVYAAGDVRILSAAPLVHIGRISYGFYLWHLPIEGEVRFQLHLAPPASFVVVVALSLLMATASLVFVERPARARGGRWIDRHWSARAPREPQLPASAE